ncbi:MAG: TauD/TfdA family dioxygenase [Candidatus Aquirickettsiella sp.]
MTKIFTLNEIKSVIKNNDFFVIKDYFFSSRSEKGIIFYLLLYEMRTYNLESIFYESRKLELPAPCYYTIEQHKAIPYIHLSATLNKYGINILTLMYQDNSATFKKIIQNLGTLHVHKEKDSFIWDIKLSKKNKTHQHLGRSHKDYEFPFHTDCSYEENIPDYFALYVLYADQKSGGKNLIIDAKLLIDALSEESLTVLQNSPITIKVPKEFFKGIDSIRACIIDENFNIRYRHEIIDFYGLTIKQLTAIKELEDLIYSAKFCRGLLLKNNQILILNNKKFLHARTQIKDPMRHLKRIRFFLHPSY